MGSEDSLQKSFKGHIILFKRGQVEQDLTMANLKSKPSVFMPCPNAYFLALVGNTGKYRENTGKYREI